MNEIGSRLLIDGSYDNLMERSLKELQKNKINYDGPGSIMKLLLSIVNKEMAGLYTKLGVSHMQGFLSHAKENNVDLIGELLNCIRITEESDEEYKYRITRQTLVSEKANETAIRLSVLSLSGIKDVIMKEYTHGAGSFSVYPVVDSIEDYTSDLLDRVEGAVRSAKGFGVRAVVLIPKISEVEMKGHVLYTKELTETEKRITAQDVTIQIRKYVNERKPGEPILINELNRMVIERHESVAGVSITHYMINQRSVFALDQEAKWNERFVESREPGSIRFT